MSLLPGDRLGPYEVVGLLGSGGMGEVYRAHDPRLRRAVAIKILRHSPNDPEHVARFSREAHAAGKLNHPNIVSVFDVGTDNGIPYVVTELLEGETLRERLDRGALPYRKALDYGIQIAQALATAHAKGIWHRDVKPANAFITNDGHIKLLDFGIAKLTEREAWVESPDATRETSQAGEIRGTAGYMAPEQVLGTPVDHRADVFALGAVLYEMFTGARAFKRPTSIETMSAVLQDEPADPLTLAPNLPSAAAAIVRRCLEKNREERFQSARDLAFNLQQLREPTGIARPLPRARSLPARNLLLVILGLTLLAEAAAIVWLWPRAPASAVFEQLTFRRGRIGGARFASAGNSVVYSEARERNVLELRRVDPADSLASRSVPYPEGSDILAAHAGQIALLLRPRFLLGERFVGTLAEAPIGGGTPRELDTNVEDADWDSSGTKLAVVHSAGDAGGESRIEYPLGTTLHKTIGSIRFVRVSPDGGRIAFLEDREGRAVGGHVATVDMTGTVKKLTDEWASVRGLAWSPRGDEVWFTAGDARTKRALHAVTLDGQQRVVLGGPGSMTLWDIARDGRLLLTRDEERRAVIGVPPGETTERDFSWFDEAGLADVSADGRWLLIGDRFGIYLRQTDGSDPIPLGLKDGFADDLSPDGNTVLGTKDGRLILVPKGAGDPQPLPAYGITRYAGARWFPDGRHILFNGTEGNRPLRSYVQDIKDGPPRAFTPENTRAISISVSGEWTAAITEGRPISIYPVSGGQSREVPGSQHGERPVGWSADDRSLWVYRRGEVPAQVFQLDVATGRRQLWKTLSPADKTGVISIVDLQITPAGHAYFYSYTQLLSQLYIVRGLQ
jgi:hypothetical protein